tara:strand:+ start:1288 stop:1863 length:576 start_codon:yes stop_codon:yes gene_type:complete
MALKYSAMLPLETQAPSFSLPDVVLNRTITLDFFSGHPGLLVMFICNHCPYVIHIQKALAKIGEDYVPKDIGIIAISSNDASTYPEDSPEKLKAMAEFLKFNFPVCYDETQEVAKAYHALCTPDFFLFGKERRLVYRGQLDDSRPGNNKPVDGASLRSAIGAVLTGHTVAVKQKPSAGCSIKWKPGNEPDT